MALQKKPAALPGEDLQPSSAGYRATWREQGMEVSASLVPEACAPSLGFVLEISCDNEPDPGPMSQGQTERAETSFWRIKTQAKEALIAAGWLVVGRLGNPPHEVWQHQDRLWGPRSVQEREDLLAQLASLGQEQTSGAATDNKHPLQVAPENSQAPSNVDEVYGDKEARERALSSGSPPALGRLVKAKSIAFACARCATQTQATCYPGAQPQYCEPCALIVRREKTRARVQKLRHKRKAQQTAL